MIKAQELRIGNLVNYKPKNRNSGFTMYPVAIFKDSVNLDFDGNEGDVWEVDLKEDISGIPLTEEWLVKFGFEKYSPDGNNEFRIKKECGGYSFEGDDSDGFLFADEMKLNVPFNPLEELSAQNIITGNCCGVIIESVKAQDVFDITYQVNKIQAPNQLLINMNITKSQWKKIA